LGESQAGRSGSSPEAFMIVHFFDLTGLKEGDTFLGCPECWFRLDSGCAAKPVCPECGSAMNVYTLTPEDVLQAVVKRVRATD